MPRLARTIPTILLLAAVAAPLGFAQSPQTRAATQAAQTKPVLTLELARLVLDGAMAEAARLNAGGAIAITDDGGHLVLLARIDGTFPAAPEVATGKARTAATFRRPTSDFENAIRSGRVTLTAVSAMTPLEGGVPLNVDGQVVGGVGVSGAHSSAEDVQIAVAGAAALVPASHTH